MRGRQSSCCFTGHRPAKLPWRYDEGDSRCVELKSRIHDAVEAAYDEGYRHFLCGMAMGCDLYFCECVLACMQRRDRYMVDHASLLIAVFDGSPGGTQYTVQYAMGRGLDIVDLPVVTARSCGDEADVLF